MTDKEEFIKIYMESVFDSSNNTGEKLWSYFQSKQQEKTERVKKLKTLTIGLITEVKLIELSDVLSILEEE